MFDTVYSETYEEELRGLERRRAHDQNCTIETIRGILKHLYIRDGQNWEGRGQLGDAISSATIAAYETVIADWEKEIKTAQPR